MRLLTAPTLALAWMMLFLRTSAGEAADEPVVRDDDHYARIANAEDDELTFDRPRETSGFVCGAYKVAAGDLDGDGILDLAVSYNQTDAISVLTGDGEFGFALAGVYHHPTDPVGNTANLTLVDIDGDGKLDIAAALHERQLLDYRDTSIPVEKIRRGWQGRVQLYRNRGDGIFTPAKRYQTPSAGKGVRVVDIDNDGIRDLVYAARGVSYIRGDLKSGRLIVRKGLGDFRFGPVKMGLAGSSAYYVETADVNGDGFLDFFCPNERAKTVTYFINPGMNIFADGVKLTARTMTITPAEHAAALKPIDRPGSHYNANDVRVADFTGDGNPDALIAWMDQAALQVQRGDGAGNFTHHSIVQAGDDAAFFGIGDFDHDGDNDFVVTHWRQEFASVGLNDGKGRFTLKRYPAGNGSYGVAVDDFDRDGHLDFVTANYRDRSMNLYQGKGDGDFTGKGELPGELRLGGGKWSLQDRQ